MKKILKITSYFGQGFSLSDSRLNTVLKKIWLLSAIKTLVI